IRLLIGSICWSLDETNTEYSVTTAISPWALMGTVRTKKILIGNDMPTNLGRKVLGGGPVPSERMLVGEAPGYREERSGVPFSGPSGSELDRYLLRASRIDRRTCFITNLVKYRPTTDRETGNNPPTNDDIARDEDELIEEIRKVKPKWILTAGMYSTRWF